MKKKSSKKSSLEDLVQKYLNAPNGSAEKRMLLGLIRLQRPDFKEVK
jgi:hypothetical protein